VFTLANLQTWRIQLAIKNTFPVYRLVYNPRFAAEKFHSLDRTYHGTSKDQNDRHPEAADHEDLLLVWKVPQNIWLPYLLETQSCSICLYLDLSAHSISLIHLDREMHTNLHSMGLLSLVYRDCAKINGSEKFVKQIQILRTWDQVANETLIRLVSNHTN